MAERLAGLSHRHRSLPVDASTPTSALAVSCTYCRWPSKSMAMAEAYAAPGPPRPPRGPPDPPLAEASGTGHFQIVLPVALSRATIVASVPPGVQITLSPSTSGDSR